MRKRASLGAVVALALVASLAPLAPASAGDERGRFIVVLKDSVSDPGAVAREHSNEHAAEVTHVYRDALKGYAASIPEGRVTGLEHDPRVDFVQRDGTSSITAQTIPTGINRMEAEKNAIGKVDGLDDRVDVDIAVIDTGVDLTHPDLNVVASTDCTAGGALGACVNGGGNDDQGHGSHVAGTIGAKDNTIGVVGVAPGARIHAVKVLSSTGYGLNSWIIAGIDWVAARSSTIEAANISISNSGGGYDAAEHRAIQNAVAKGVVMVVAASNEARDVYGKDGTFGTGDDTSPASFPEAMTISALSDFDGVPGGLKTGSYSFSVCTESKDDSFACFSNFSNSVVSNNPVNSPGGAIDLMLPGVAIYSTYMAGTYATASGTSMASPHAAGLVGLYIAANGRATSAAGVYSIRQALINAAQSQTSANGLTTHDDPDTKKEGLGWGLGWTGSGGGGTPPPPNVAPSASFSSSCTDLSCSFTDTSTDSDGTISSWSWTFGDGGTSTAQHPSHSYASAGTYTVSLTVTDNAGATSTASKSVTVTNPPPPSGISLSATGYKVKGQKNVDLTWSGASGTNVDVYRNGVLVATTANDGAHTDAIASKGGGTFTYKVCEAGTTTCSNEASVTF